MKVKWRNAIDLIAISVANVATGIFAGMAAWRIGQSAMFIVPVIGIAAVYALLRSRRESWDVVGLHHNFPSLRDVGLGVLVAGAFLFLTFALEATAVLDRNLSALRAQVDSSLWALAGAMLYSILGAGLYEEITFRGFLMQRVAVVFGDTRAAWFTGNLAQAAIFGLVHGHQGLGGILYTGGVAFLLGLVFLALGRNLWPLIVGHALYDASRFVYFYLS